MKTNVAITLAFLFTLLLTPAVGRAAEKSPIDWEAQIHPKYRGMLEGIKVLLITPSNVDVLWDLEDHPDRADVVFFMVRDISIVSSAQQDVLANWVRSGKGIVCSSIPKQDCIGGYTPFLHAEVEIVSQSNSEEAGISKCVATQEKHPLLIGVKAVKCSPEERRTEAFSPGWFNYSVFPRKQEQSFTPLFEDSSKRVVAVAKDFGRGRVLIFPLARFIDGLRSIDSSVFDIYNHGAIAQYDGARFYLNAMLWLWGKEVPGR